MSDIVTIRPEDRPPLMEAVRKIYEDYHRKREDAIRHHRQRLQDIEFELSEDLAQLERLYTRPTKESADA